MTILYSNLANNFFFSVGNGVFTIRNNYCIGLKSLTAVCSDVFQGHLPTLQHSPPQEHHFLCRSVKHRSSLAYPAWGSLNIASGLGQCPAWSQENPVCPRLLALSQEQRAPGHHWLPPQMLRPRGPASVGLHPGASLQTLEALNIARVLNAHTRLLSSPQGLAKKSNIGLQIPTGKGPQLAAAGRDPHTYNPESCLTASTPRLLSPMYLC